MSLIDLEDFRIRRPYWGRCGIADYFKKIDYDKFKKDLEKTDYAGRQIKTAGGRSFTRMHHYIIGFPSKKMHVDHVNGDGLDNRLINLRMVTKRQNCQNRRYAKKSSKYPGVYWNSCASKWVAQITLNGKWKYLGLYTNELDAFNAYEKATNQLNDSVLES